MAIIKKKVLKTMKNEELKAKLSELRQELLSFRAKTATAKTADNPGKYSQIKKTIARIKTFAAERKIGGVE